MANNEILKMEYELEIKRIELEIKELELELLKNSYESIKAKEEIDESDIPEEEVEGFIENTLSGTNSNNDVLLDNLMKIGALSYNYYSLEDEKFSLIGLKKELEEKIERL